MDSISTPDLDSTLKLLAGADLIDRNGCKKNMDYMNTDIVLEVPDTPDRLPVDRSPGPSLGKEGIEGEADTSSSDGRMGHSRNSYDRRLKDSDSPNVVGSIVAVNDTEAPATEFEFEKTRVSNESKKSAEIVDLSQKSPFPFSFPTRCRDSRRNNGKPPFRENKGSKSGRYAELFGTESSFPNRSIEKPESGSGLVFDWENAALKSGDKGKGIDLSSDPEVKIEQVPSRPLKLGVSQRKTGRRQLASNNYLSHCNISKSRIQSEVDCQDIMKSVDGETCSDSSTDPQAKAKPAQSRLFNPDASQRKTGQRRLTRHSYIPPCNIQPEVDDQTIIKTVDGETFSSFTGISSQDDRKNGDIYNTSQPKTGQAPLCLTESNTGVRRPVPRGCTSPYNMRDKKVAEDDVVKPLVELRGGISSHQINIVSPDSEGSHADKKKGKVKSDANAVGNMQHVKAKTRSGRVFSTSGKEVTVIADIDDDTPGSSEDFGYRTTRNRKEKASRYPSHDIVRLSKREGINNYSSDQSHETSTGDRGYMNLVHESPEITISRHGVNPSPGRASSESESETRRRDRRHKFMKGKKRYSSLHFTSGESSSSVFGDSEISYLYSSGRGSDPKSTKTLNSQRHDTSLGPVIEVDDLHSPELRCHSAQEQSCRVNVSSAKATQVESDEMLARQLQEQFYDESPGFGGTEEIDATIARSLQEEDARLAASIGRRSRSYSRDTSISHLYAYYPQMPSRNAPPRWTNRARVLTSNRVAQMSRNFSSPEMDIETTMLAHLRRNFNSAEMDVDTRLHFLEALEAAFDNNDDMAFSNNVLQIQRDFNENDYEMLLALDDNNHHVGASERQINSLPQSVIQSDGMEEACAICLETPADGEIIRHLPCLHKFHKDCIDTWLRRRTSCPICKSGINSP